MLRAEAKPEGGRVGSLGGKGGLACTQSHAGIRSGVWGGSLVPERECSVQRRNQKVGREGVWGGDARAS
jgi:hypothetical protein